MAREQTITIRFKNWNKFNPRGESKRPNWFRMDNAILDHEDLFDLSSDQFRALVFLFCQASKKNSDTVRIRFAHALDKYKIKSDVIMSTILRLKQADMVEQMLDSHEVVHDSHELARDSHEVLRDSPATENTNITENTNTAPPDLDFEFSYEKYPRKVGKSEGFTRLKKLITTPADLEQFELAVRNYAEECRVNGVEEKYIKHFSSFVGVAGKEVWRDYITWRPSKKPPQDKGPPPIRYGSAEDTKKMLEEQERTRGQPIAPEKLQELLNKAKIKTVGESS